MAMTENEIKDAFDEFLNEQYKPYTVRNPGDPYDTTGVTMYPAEILKSTDPIAYRTFMSNWADRYGLEEEDEEDDSDNECEGHESLNGNTMGASVFCDGSCKTDN